LPREEDCYSYYECDYGEAILNHCPQLGNERLVFNPVEQKCDYPWHYPCENHINYVA
ncbi:hypothetical protein CGJ15_24970, partial [Vibrio parahaemolyticus]